MEELLEMITWCQLGIHDKPVSELTDRKITTRISNAFLSVRQQLRPAASSLRLGC
jgi:predicted Rossmann-fold nucleotide-binding protein